MDEIDPQPMVLGKYNRRRTFNQNFISGIVLFFTVGIYLAVLGLGAGGGQPSSQVRTFHPQ